MPVKRCPKCGEEKELTSEFWYYRNDTGEFRSICKKCWKDKSREYELKYPEKRKEAHKRNALQNCKRARQWYNKNKNRAIGRTRNKTLTDPIFKERFRGYQRKSAEKKRAELGGSYIRKMLKQAGLPVTDDIIALKRQQITMYRTLNQFKQFRKEKENESNSTNV